MIGPGIVEKVVPGVDDVCRVYVDGFEEGVGEEEEDEEEDDDDDDFGCGALGSIPEGVQWMDFVNGWWSSFIKTPALAKDSRIVDVIAGVFGV